MPYHSRRADSVSPRAPARGRKSSNVSGVLGAGLGVDREGDEVDSGTAGDGGSLDDGAFDFSLMGPRDAATGEDQPVSPWRGGLVMACADFRLPSSLFHLLNTLLAAASVAFWLHPQANVHRAEPSSLCSHVAAGKPCPHRLLDFLVIDQQ